MTTNPWDVREAKKLESDPDALYLSIGRALSEWERMEVLLSHYFAFFCGGRDNLSARRAYGSVIAFSGRSSMLKKAAEAHFHLNRGHKMEATFLALTDRADKFSPRRNEIAHGIVAVIGFKAEKAESDPTKRIEQLLRTQLWLLTPSEYAANKHILTNATEPASVLDTFESDSASKRKYAYSTVEIDHYADQFTDLRADLWALQFRWAEAHPEEAEDIIPPI